MANLTHLLSTVELEAREALIAEAQAFLFPPGEIIYIQGDPVNGIYVVIEGLVKGTAYVEGELQFVRLVGPGEIMGAAELLSGSPQTMSATALRETRLCWLKGTSLQEIFKEYPDVLLWLMRNLSCQLSELRAAIVETVHVESATRLTRRLLEVAERFGERTPQGLVLDLDLSRDEWAALAGLAPETVSRILHRLSSRGWIALEGRQIRMIQEEKLRRSEGG